MSAETHLPTIYPTCPGPGPRRARRAIHGQARGSVRVIGDGADACGSNRAASRGAAAAV